MTGAFGASDAEGGWDWKAAYDACEVAQILLLRRYGATPAVRKLTPIAQLAMWQRLAGRIPTHTRRSLESQAMQQFSTPLRSEEHTSELQSLMRISYAVFCLKKK